MMGVDACLSMDFLWRFLSNLVSLLFWDFEESLRKTYLLESQCMLVVSLIQNQFWNLYKSESLPYPFTIYHNLLFGEFRTLQIREFMPQTCQYNASISSLICGKIFACSVVSEIWGMWSTIHSTDSIRLWKSAKFHQIIIIGIVNVNYLSQYLVF